MEEEYDGFLNAPQLTQLPLATELGNHDCGYNTALYGQHFTLPNISEKYGQVSGDAYGDNAVDSESTGDGDYYFTYNNTLYMVLNTSCLSIAEHKAFLEETIQANPDVTWKVVSFHKSIYSVASHVTESDIVTLRNGLSPILSQLGIDIVLQGHDHVYARSYIMGGESGTSHMGNTYYYYKCGKAKRHGKAHCDLKAIRKEPLERFVVETAIKVIFSDEIIERLIDLIMEAQQQENTRLPVLKEQLRDTEKRLANLLEAIEQGILTPTTKQRLDELEARKEALNTSILEEELKKPVLTREWMRFWFEKFRKGDMRDMEHQRQIIDTFVNSVYVFDDRVVLNFNFTDDSKTISREEVLGSSAVDNAPLKDPLSFGSGFFIYQNLLNGKRSGMEWNAAAFFLFEIRRCCPERVKT